MGYNKFVYNDKTLIDLTEDTVTTNALLRNTKAHDRSGEPIIGECDFDIDSSSATAQESELLYGKTACVKGKTIIGTMPNNEAVIETITSKDQRIPIREGYHNGRGLTEIDCDERSKLTQNNVRLGINILGVEGKLRDIEDAVTQTKTVTPNMSEQTITRDKEYDFLDEVIVKPIPYRIEENSSRGVTFIIAQ